MKIRSGYVSNSSSSSFCLMGICINTNNFVKEYFSEELLNKLNTYSTEYWEESNNLYSLFSHLILSNDPDNVMADFEIENGIGVYSNEDLFIGCSPDSMKDDETLLQFKTRILNSLNKVGVKCKIENLSWFIDGGESN